MNECIEAKINELGGKIDIIESLSRALTSSICGSDELTQKDACNFVFLVEDKLKELKNMHNDIVDELKI